MPRPKASIDVPAIKMLKGGNIPVYKTPGSAGFDFVAAHKETIPSHGVASIRTGLYMEIPKGHEVQIRPRSGLAGKGITVINSPGTIDSDYRGEVCVLMVNHTPFTYYVEAGDRIAQGMLAPVIKATFEEVDTLSATKRGKGGFGSTGK